MIVNMPEGLTALEHRVFTHYIEHEASEDLREGVASQLAYALAGDLERTGVGFFRPFTVPVSAPIARSLPDARIDIGYAEHPDLVGGAMFMLNVEEGAVACLEAITMTGDWPRDEESFLLR
jgi:hypothetical protein